VQKAGEPKSWHTGVMRAVASSRQGMEVRWGRVDRGLGPDGEDPFGCCVQQSSFYPRGHREKAECRKGSNLSCLEMGKPGTLGRTDRAGWYFRKEIAWINLS
jgi:hypothetical protein